MFLSALDAALEFRQKQVVPSCWKTEVKEESSSSEEEDEDEEDEQEEDGSGEEEEVRGGTAHHLSSLHPPSEKQSSSVLLFPVCRRKWSLSQRRGRTFCSSSTSSWRTEVSAGCIKLMFTEFTLYGSYQGSCRNASSCCMFIICRNAHQQEACSGLQESEPFQALQTRPQTGRL